MLANEHMPIVEPGLLPSVQCRFVQSVIAWTIILLLNGLGGHVCSCGWVIHVYKVYNSCLMNTVCMAERCDSISLVMSEPYHATHSMC